MRREGSARGRGMGEEGLSGQMAEQQAAFLPSLQAEGPQSGAEAPKRIELLVGDICEGGFGTAAQLLGGVASALQMRRRLEPAHAAAAAPAPAGGDEVRRASTAAAQRRAPCCCCCLTRSAMCVMSVRRQRASACSTSVQHRRAARSRLVPSRQLRVQPAGGDARSGAFCESNTGTRESATPRARLRDDAEARVRCMPAAAPCAEARAA